MDIPPAAVGHTVPRHLTEISQVNTSINAWNQCRMQSMKTGARPTAMKDKTWTSTSCQLMMCQKIWLALVLSFLTRT
jgi:hypothetical protein